MRSLSLPFFSAAVLLLVSCERSSPSAGANPHGGNGGKDATDRPPVSVQISQITFASVPKTIEAVGTLYADEDAILSAKVPGRICSISADVGDRLPAGSELARVDPVDYQTALDQRRLTLHETLAQLGLQELPGADFDATTVPTVQKAKAEVDNARSRMERAEKLFKTGDGKTPMIPEQDYEDRKTEYEVAAREHDVSLLAARSLLAQARTRESDRVAAQQRLEDTIIRTPLAKDRATLSSPDTGSPVSTTPPPPTPPPTPLPNPPPTPLLGQAPSYAVAERQVTVGTYVREGDPLFRVVADDTLRFRGAVPERFSGQVKVGQAVRIVTVSAPGKTFPGKVTRISPAVDLLSRAFQVEATLDNREHLLRPGSFSRAAIVVGDLENVAFIPKEALVSFAGIDRAYSIDNGKAVEHNVSRLILPDGVTAPVAGIAVENIPPTVRALISSNTGQIAKNTPVRIVDTPTAH